MLASGIQPAKFELEMVQHRPGLELLVTTAGPTGAVLVTFLLPLFAEQAAWSPRTVCAVDDASSVYFPDVFNYANFDDVEADRSAMTLSIVYALPDTHSEHASHSWRPVSTAVQWPSSLRLSQQVVQMPLPSQELSCVETLSYCEQVSRFIVLTLSRERVASISPLTRSMWGSELFRAVDQAQAVYSRAPQERRWYVVVSLRVPSLRSCLHL